MRDPFARQFYSSGAWADCREAYKKSVGNLCEYCAKMAEMGYDVEEIKPIDEVHHKIRLTPQNINDPNITLNWDNLEGLCESCHKSAHKRKRRYSVDANGRVTIQDAPLGENEERAAPYSGVLLRKALSGAYDPSLKEGD